MHATIRKTWNNNELTHLHRNAGFFVSRVGIGKFIQRKVLYYLPWLFIVHHQINSSCWICWESQKLHRFTLQRELKTLLLLSQWKWLFIPSTHSQQYRMLLLNPLKLRVEWQKASFCLQNLCDLSLFLRLHSQHTNCFCMLHKFTNSCPSVPSSFIMMKFAHWGGSSESWRENDRVDSALLIF